MIVGALRVGVWWSGWHNLTSKLGAWFVGIIEQGDEVAAG